MLLSLDISEKSFGDKQLYNNLKLDIQEGEKVGLIGRNGTGKSTLLNMVTGDDLDYQGKIEIKQSTVVIASRQEHHGFEHHTVLEYIQGDLPEFAELHHILDTYPEHMGDNTRKQQAYSDALERFSHLGYFQIEDELRQAFEAYQIDPDKLDADVSQLSGGQKRMVELIKVQRARGHLALIDEPTNHMDYVAKEAFIKWLKATEEAVLVITHDRDVLSIVDKLVEIRDGRAYMFKGNYAAYLKTNTLQITSQVNEYDLVQRRTHKLEGDLIRFRRLKEKARDPGTIKRFKSQEYKVAAELAKLGKAEKPSFWIDRDNAEDMNPKLTGAYEKYKAKNIQLTTTSKESRSSRLLVETRNISLGYEDIPLFEGIDMSLHEGERIRLHGRNGAGKTTLVNAIMAKAAGTPAPSQLFSGTIAIEKDLNIGMYEQEIDAKYLPVKLRDAIEQSCFEKDVPVSEQKVQQLLSQYLFNPNDGDTPIERLSGGQKARFQLIRMLLSEPLLLVLDEPTNHLDLPSIEELEDALKSYHGAVIYISHDSYFAQKVGGKTIAIGK
ncbi:MAG: ATP-binding cassette domain-containing protein [Patescibacteria group bacterium]|nr:ATP-binding cassette domain-containing protein [Patescibacteria group bacterium]